MKHRTIENQGEVNNTWKKQIPKEYPLKTGEYILRGPEAVKLVLSLGHGAAGDYKPEK